MFICSVIQQMFVVTLLCVKEMSLVLHKTSVPTKLQPPRHSPRQTLK